MRSLIFCCVVFLLLSVLFFPVFAHPGKTDSNGGHYDHEDGSYHYHHGYPAHKHPGGVCPYDFDDKTDHSGKNNSSSVTKEEAEKETSDSDDDIFVYVLFGAFIIALGGYIWYVETH